MNGLEMRRRAMMGTRKTSRLPSGFQEVAWLESTGSQCIEIQTVNWSVDTATIDMVCSYDSAYNTRQLNGTNGQGFWGKRDNNLSEVVSSYVATDMSKIVHFILTKTVGEPLTGTVNGRQVIGAYQDTADINYRFCIFAIGNKLTVATPYQLYGFMKIHSFHCVFGGQNASEHNLAPCYRESDNKPGMYDLCGSICPLTNSPFYINAGTGEFLVGPEVN